MSSISTAPSNPSLAARILDRKTSIALLLCSSIWVLPWSRTFQLSVLILATASITLLIRQRRNWWTPGAASWCAMNLCAALALGLSALTTQYPDKPLELMGFQLVLWLAGMAILYWARNDQIWQRLQWCLFAIIGFWLVDGLFQALVGFDLLGVPRSERLGGYFSHPDKFGFYISFLCAWVLFAPVVRRWSLPLQGMAYLLCLAVTFFGNTRAGWVSFMLISAVWLYMSRAQIRAVLRTAPWLLGLVAAAVGAASWWILQDPQVSKRITATIPQSFDLAGIAAVIPIRAQLWAQAWEQFLANPWFGTGAGNYSLYLPDSWTGTSLFQPYTHQVVLEILAGTGAIGSLLYFTIAVIFLTLVWRALCSKSATTRDESQLPVAPLLILFCVWFPFNTHRELFSSEMMVLTWLSMALVIARLNHTESSIATDTTNK
ncbi:O-antigen ligase family protein [Microbulbifer agarilyticus]|uniref:O-antigen ligase family protein n=1 Tax=Microbulbifer agarilyticus TaxID=260552 RepID=UPI001CD3A63F|nr:O-antigen ligase family protein [Microbulbifer agarilyticus]MCA0892688.1 O-antigen ligase family protein [Microbulbifer agarilyticus]